MTVAICPGSFDPVTVGHLDVIRRSSGLFETVIVAVGSNVRKDGARLSGEERARLVEQATVELENVEVEVMSGLLVDFARQRGAGVVIKGLRSVRDFEAEREQAQMNRAMYPKLEAAFFVAAPEHGYLSSSLVREIAYHGGEVRGMVPEKILQSVRQIYSGRNGNM